MTTREVKEPSAANSKFDAFAKYIVIIANQANKEHYLKFAKEGFAQSGRGAVVIYPVDETDWPNKCVEDVQIGKLYLPLKPELDPEDPIHKSVKSYDTERAFVLVVLPHCDFEDAGKPVPFWHEVIS
jgi:hypothetical protein